MKTYVTVTISSEGEKASIIAEKFKELGFKSTLGTHDFVYEWKGKDIAPVQVINFVDKVQTKLKGKNVLLNFTTF
jgi:hypothetical protein